MSGVPYIALGELMASRVGSVDPTKFPDEVFDLYSIPAFDKGPPDIAVGTSIGSSKQIVRPGDVLLSKIVPHIRRSWVVGIDRGRRLIASGEWIVFRSERIDQAYLRHVLIGDPFHSQFMQTVSGVGGSLLRARPVHVAKITVPLPPLPEQRRIAAILDQADALRAKRRETLAQLDSLTQSIFIAMFGNPVANHSPWVTSRLGMICTKISDGTHHSPPIQTEGVPYITAKHLKEYGLDFYSSPWFIAERDHRQIYARCDPKPGDVLYIKDGATTGIAAINNYSFEFSMLSSLALLRPDGEILNSSYLSHWLNSPTVKTELIGEMAGAAIRRLTLTKIKAISIPVPPLKLQAEFAQRMSAIERVKEKKKQSLCELDTLFTSLQHRAFQGEL